MEAENSRQRPFFSFSEIWYRPLEFNLEKFANFWGIEQDGICVIKFEAAKKHFLTDVFVAVAVAVVDA